MKRVTMVSVGVGVFIVTATIAVLMMVYVVPSWTSPIPDKPSTNTQQEIDSSSDSITAPYSKMECINDASTGQFCIQE